jgi:hypothetical protein
MSAARGYHGAANGSRGAENLTRRWAEFCQMPSARTAKALRILLGLSPNQAACGAGLPPDVLKRFENNTLGMERWHLASRKLDRVYKSLGGGWCDPDLHQGANFVFLAHGAASDRQAILAALALLGFRAHGRNRLVSLALLERRTALSLRLPVAKLRDALRSSERMPRRIRNECFRQLSDGGAYFDRAPLGGWQLVGCDPAGCWW